MHLGVLIGDLGPVVKVCNGSGRPKAVRGHTDAYRIKDHVWSLAAVGERIQLRHQRGAIRVPFIDVNLARATHPSDPPKQRGPTGSVNGVSQRDQQK